MKKTFQNSKRKDRPPTQCRKDKSTCMRHKNVRDTVVCFRILRKHEELLTHTAKSSQVDRSAVFDSTVLKIALAMEMRKSRKT